jgi:hypothetical protein
MRDRLNELKGQTPPPVKQISRMTIDQQNADFSQLTLVASASLKYIPEQSGSDLILKDVYISLNARPNPYLQ